MQDNTLLSAAVDSFSVYKTKVKKSQGVFLRQVMTVTQANNLDGITAAAVTSAQLSLLPTDVRGALSSAKSENLRSGASGELLATPARVGY